MKQEEHIKQIMDDYLKKALEKLNINEIKMIIDWLLDRKRICYGNMTEDVDFDNEFYLLNPLEDKLRNIFASLIQKADCDYSHSKIQNKNDNHSKKQNGASNHRIQSSGGINVKI